MKKRKSLTTRETIVVASTLFGMFFGAGNLIFPVHLGQMAGSQSVLAIVGFCITAVTIPILAVIAIGNTHSDNIYQLSGKVGKKYAWWFTFILYLTIGPLFAIPRCASVSFETGVAPLTEGAGTRIFQLIFTFIFFAFVLYFSLKPGKITVWIGKVINPLFLVFLGILVVASLISPGAPVSEVAPTAEYESGALFSSIIEGYGTMDAIAGLAFGIVVINIIRDLGVDDDNDVARESAKSGVLAGVLMIVIYALTIIMGAQSRGLFELSDNGAIALTQLSGHYLGAFGSFVLAFTITFACLKTAIGLVTSCAEMFLKLIPAIIKYAVPVLMLIYPLAITLTVLAIFDKVFGGSRWVYVCVTVLTAIPAVFDCLKALGVSSVAELGSKVFPFYDLGLGWVVPALIGLVIGLLLTVITKGKSNEAAA